MAIFIYNKKSFISINLIDIINPVGDIMKEKFVKILLYVLILLLGFDLGFIVNNIIDKKYVSADGWLSFLGAIVGGIIAAISIYVTVARAKEEVREKEIKDVRPFIVFKPEFNKDFMEAYSTLEDNCHYTIDSTVENVSDKLVNNLRLLDEDVYIYNSETDEYNILDPMECNYNIYTVLLDSNEMIKAHDKFAFHTNFIISNYSKTKEKGTDSFKVITRFTYRDILDLVEYTHYTEYELIIDYTNKGEYFLFYNSLVNRTESYKNLKTGEIVKL